MNKNMKTLVYKSPEIDVEDTMPEQMLCDSFVGGLEDTVDEPIY